MPLTPIFLTATPTTSDTIEGLLGVETLGSLGGVVFIIYTLYKLGTVEAVLKLLLTALLGIILLYAAGYITPSLQTSSWHQLIAYILEEIPQLILQNIGANPT